MKKFCRIFASIVTVLLLPSCVADSKYQPKVKTDISKPQWKEENGGAALPLAAAKDFCITRVVVERARERTQRWTSRRAIEGVIARILSTREDRRRRVSLLARASWTR